MTALPYQLMVDDTEQHIIDLKRQLTDLQKINTLTDSKRDYGDFIETSILIKKEISLLRKGLNRENNVEEIYEEEEEEIEHIIRDEKTGKYREIKKEDLSLEKNKNIYKAFKEIYKMGKYKKMKTYEEEEEEEQTIDEIIKEKQKPAINLWVEQNKRMYEIYTKICEVVRFQQMDDYGDERGISRFELMNQEAMIELLKKREKEKKCRSTI